MVENKKFTLALICVQSLLFLLACVSIVLTIMNITEKSQMTDILSCVYLFMQIVIVSFAIVQTAKAYKYEGKIMKVMMLDENFIPVKKEKIKMLVLTIIGFAIGLFFTLIATCLHFADQTFTFGLKMALMNFGYMLFIGGLCFFIYPYLNHREEKK